MRLRILHLIRKDLYATCMKPVSTILLLLFPVSTILLLRIVFNLFFLLVLSFCIGKFLCYFLLTTTARDPIATWRRCLGDWLVAADAVLHDTYLGDRLLAPHTSHQSTGL